MTEPSIVSCQGKQRYVTRHAAQKIVDAMRKKNKVGIYRCQSCRFYHIGRTVPKIAKRKI